MEYLIIFIASMAFVIIIHNIYSKIIAVRGAKKKNITSADFEIKNEVEKSIRSIRNDK